MKKSTLFSRFIRETRFGLVASCFVIALAMIQSVSASTITAVQTAPLTTAVDVNTASTWTGALLPSGGDGNIWSSGAKYLKIGTVANTAVSFNGGTLDLATGGSFQSFVASPNVTMNAITLNGGRIYSANNASVVAPNSIPFYLNLSGNTFTLNSGSIVTTTTLTGRPTFTNCLLAGSGTITIGQYTAPAGGTALVNWVDFQSTVSTSGFTGKFIVSPGTTGTYPGATLKLATNPTSGNSGTYAVSVPATLTGYSSSVSGKLSYYAPATGTTADSTLTLASLTLGTTAIAPGTYKRSDFSNYGGTTDLTGYLDIASTGYIKIPAVAPNAPTSVVATNANGIASVAFTGVATSFTVTPFDVTTSTAGTPVTGSSSPILLPALNVNDNYTFTVTATSVSGTSAASSASNPITITVPGTVTAVTGLNSPITNIYDLAAWSSDNSIPVPVLGDANTWSTGAFKLFVSTTPYTFNGATLEVVNGGALSMGTGSSMLYLNNVMLNGLTGIIQNQSGFNATLDLQGKTFTLNSGSLKTLGTADPSVTPKDLLIQNCSLAGSGTITIAQIQAGAYYCNVELLSSVNTTGFTGTIEVAPGLVVSSVNGTGGTLKLNAITSGTFGVKVLAPDATNGVSSNSATGAYKSTLNGKLYFTAGTGTVTITSLNLGGTAIAPATYTLAQLNGYLGADLSAYLNQASTGTITVTGIATGLNPLAQNNLVVVKENGFQLNKNVSSLQVYNSVGACIFNKQNVSASAFISMPYTGIYIVKAETEKGISVQKIMIK